MGCRRRQLDRHRSRGNVRLLLIINNFLFSSSPQYHFRLFLLLLFRITHPPSPHLLHLLYLHLLLLITTHHPSHHHFSYHYSASSPLIVPCFRLSHGNLCFERTVTSHLPCGHRTMAVLCDRAVTVQLTCGTDTDDVRYSYRLYFNRIRRTYVS